MGRDGEVKQRQHFYHHGDTICHPKSDYVTTKLHVDATIMRSFQAELFSSLLPSTYSFLPKYRVIYYDYIIVK